MSLRSAPACQSRCQCCFEVPSCWAGRPICLCLVWAVCLIPRRQAKMRGSNKAFNQAIENSSKIFKVCIYHQTNANAASVRPRNKLDAERAPSCSLGGSSAVCGLEMPTWGIKIVRPPSLGTIEIQVLRFLRPVLFDHPFQPAIARFCCHSFWTWAKSPQLSRLC